MVRILKNILCLLFVNFLADVGSFSLIFVMLNVMLVDTDSDAYFVYNFSIAIIILLLLCRLFVLPFAYDKFENSQTFDLVAKFIQKLRQSPSLKIIVLLIVYVCHITHGFTWFKGGLYGQLMTSLICGLLGSYLVLYLYWFVKDKIKKFAPKISELAERVKTSMKILIKLINILKNVICFLVINFWACVGTCFIILFEEQLQSPENNFAYMLILPFILIIISHLLILPIVYDTLENSQELPFIAKFVQRLKQSNLLKIFVLILSYFCFHPTIAPISKFSHGQFFLYNLTFGLFSSYIILYFYWFLCDKINISGMKRRQK